MTDEAVFKDVLSVMTDSQILDNLSPGGLLSDRWYLQSLEGVMDRTTQRPGWVDTASYVLLPAIGLMAGAAALGAIPGIGNSDAHAASLDPYAPMNIVAAGMDTTGMRQDLVDHTWVMTSRDVEQIEGMNMYSQDMYPDAFIVLKRATGYADMIDHGDIVLFPNQAAPDSLYRVKFNPNNPPTIPAGLTAGDISEENATASSDASTVRIPIRNQAYGAETQSASADSALPLEAEPEYDAQKTSSGRGTSIARIRAFVSENGDTNEINPDFWNSISTVYATKQPAPEVSVVEANASGLEETVKAEDVGLGTRLKRLLTDDEGNFSLNEAAQTAEPLYAWGVRIFEEMFGEQSSGIAAYTPIEICDVAQTEPGHIWPVTTFPEHQL